MEIAKHTSRVPADMFTALIDMMAVVEGGIMTPTDTSFSSATNHAMYGIILKGDVYLLYDKTVGFTTL